MNLQARKLGSIAVAALVGVGLVAAWAWQLRESEATAKLPNWQLQKQPPPRWVAANAEDIELPLVPVMARLGGKPVADVPKSAALKLIESQAISVMQLIELLDARAKAGDAEAACQIAQELTRCRGVRGTHEAFEQSQIAGLAARGLATAESEKRTAEMVEAFAYNQQVRENCAGISSDHYQQIPRYFLIAARKGHMASMVNFASARGIGGEEIVADPALYALYRENAFGHFSTAFNAGYPWAASLWSGALASQGYQFFAGVLPPQWQTPGVANALMVRIYEYVDLGNTINPTVTITAQDRQRANELFDRHFANSEWVRAGKRENKPPADQPYYRKTESGSAMCEGASSPTVPAGS